MLKIAVCDDEPLDLNRIQDLVSEYIKDHPNPGVTITRFDSSESLLAVSYTHLTLPTILLV